MLFCNNPVNIAKSWHTLKLTFLDPDPEQETSNHFHFPDNGIILGLWMNRKTIISILPFYTFRHQGRKYFFKEIHAGPTSEYKYRKSLTYNHNWDCNFAYVITWPIQFTIIFTMVIKLTTVIVKVNSTSLIDFACHKLAGTVGIHDHMNVKHGNCCKCELIAKHENCNHIIGMVWQL